jgi:hypothetical protein
MSDFKFTASRTENTDKNFPNATAWRVRITNPRGETMTRKFYMGSGHKGRKPTLNEVMFSLITDAACVMDTNPREFMADYGYEEYAHALKAYRACTRTAEKLETFLLDDEYALFTED